MRTKILTFWVFGLLCWWGIQGAPASGSDVALLACLEISYCDPEGPVCAIDDRGEPRTFKTRCLVDMEYCRTGRFYTVIRPGEC